jgi:hypothetical protein
MANTTIRLRKSGVTSNVPVSLELGELALNYADGKLYYKNASGVITYISSGATTNSFATINSNSSLILATSNTDILTLVGSNNITINTDTINKKITIGASLTSSLFANSPNIGASANATAQLYDLYNTVQGIATYAANQASYLTGYSNAAFAQANAATSLAQSAYNYANTITGGGGSTTFFNYLTVQKQLYTANASQTNFFVNYTAPYVTVVVNGATIDSSEYSTATANTIILNNPASVGDVVDITGFYQANSATITSGGSGTDQWVRDKANTASANTIVTQGVDLTQNTNITTANNAAWAAYAAGNTNATNITAVNGYAGSAYNTANGANGLAAGAYNKANNALANTTGTFAGDLTTTGNIIISSTQSSTSNTTGSLKVNGGVGVTGNVYADKIFVNGLFWAANGNVISTGSGTSSVNQFNIYKYIATAGQTTFSGPDSASVSLNYTVGAIIVTLNGITLKPGTDFTATDGTTIVVTVACNINDELNVYAFQSTTVNTNTLTTYNYLASANQSSFGGADIYSNVLGYVPGNIFTTYNGITLRSGVDYTASNGTYINLTFNANANDEITVYTFGAFNVANTYTKIQSDARYTTAGKNLAINFFRS